MSIPKWILNQYDVKLVSKWTPPEGDDLRPLIAMPNIPKPLHGVAPRTVLGTTTWNHMRKAAYFSANNTCEICGEKPEQLRRRHGHEVYEIDYEKGTAKFVRVFCICSLDHLACIHTGRAITLYKQGNPLYPKEFLLEGAEKAFKTIAEYNKDHPGADLRAYGTFLEYLKQDELRDQMNELIFTYGTKFYLKDLKKFAPWGDWKLIIGNREFPTPYADESEWEAAMEERGKKDTARIAQKNMEEKFTGGVYDDLDKIINTIDANTSV
jgi:hypothetical protein